ncbi:hypothetical protein PCANC_24554 [Puccinia coronata f. sp. avenae]|uniref:Uncharacterized protein n=1 Tax=Puccinia coronata f. sp. avenae TaxID=200324 RepID=A0A2N5TN61_9BASI|nr:hypothetical protein PCANC_24554 [Puccinia coronata f. sp. avenae]
MNSLVPHLRAGLTRPTGCPWCKLAQPGLSAKLAGLLGLARGRPEPAQLAPLYEG